MKHPILIIILLSILVSGCGINWDKRKISEWQFRQMKTTEALKTELEIEWPSYDDTLKKLRAILKKYHSITWTSGNEDYFRTYKEVVENDFKGDCADISAYWYELIRREEIIPDEGFYFKWVDMGSENHTVLIIDHPEGQIIIDNGKIKFNLEYESVIAKYDLWSVYYVDSGSEFDIY